VEQVVHVAAHAPCADNLGGVGDGVGEAGQPAGGVVGGFDRDEDGDGQAELVGVQHGDAGADDAGFLHALDALPARGGGEADFVRDVVEGHGGVYGDEAQDGAVYVV
jgi:hypothetical protein